MKRYFQILFAGGLLSLLAIQSYGAVTVGNSLGQDFTDDSSWTIAHWNETQLSGGSVFAYDQNDTLIDPGNNDVFEFTVGAGLVGLLTVIDLGAPSDSYDILNFNGGALIASTVGGVANNSGNIQSPSDAFADPNYHRLVAHPFAAGDWAINIEQGQADAGVETGNSGGVALRLEVIPEPSVSLLAMLGVVGLVVRRRRS